jgi:hypothetical protein
VRESYFPARRNVASETFKLEPRTASFVDPGSARVATIFTINQGFPVNLSNISLLVVFSCLASGVATGCSSTSSAATGDDANQTATRGATADGTCFVQYSQAAGRCDQSAGKDDAAFDKCLSSVKNDLTACCQRSGGTPSCAEEAHSPAEAAQMLVDGDCSVKFSQAGLLCSNSAGKDDAAFGACLDLQRLALKQCCVERRGSPSCAKDAETAPTRAQNTVDGQCFVDYVHAAGRCNTTAGNDDAAFNKCLAPVKADLKTCCDTRGGSPTCAGDATQPGKVPACAVAPSAGNTQAKFGVGPRAQVGPSGGAAGECDPGFKLCQIPAAHVPTASCRDVTDCYACLSSP